MNRLKFYLNWTKNDVYSSINNTTHRTAENSAHSTNGNKNVYGIKSGLQKPELISLSFFSKSNTGKEKKPPNNLDL